MKGKHSARRQRDGKHVPRPPVKNKKKAALATPAAQPHVWQLGKRNDPPDTVPTPTPTSEPPRMATAVRQPDPRDTLLEDMAFSGPVCKALEAEGLKTAGELADRTTKIPGVGAARKDEVRARLASIGLTCQLP